MAEEWIGKMFEVQSLQQNHLSETYSWPTCGYHSVCEWSSGEVKGLFFDQLGAVTARIPGFEFLIPWGDWNGHVGHAGTGYREMHGGMGYSRPEPDVEGDRTLEYTLAFNLILGNTCSKNVTAISSRTSRES